jgi:uncharacterized protein
VRVVLDTNIFISALITPNGISARIIAAWKDKSFDLIGHELLIAEVRSALRYPKLANQYNRLEVGKLINAMRKKALMLDKLRRVDRSLDPNDNFVLAIAQDGRADFLVTGDKSGLLALGTHGPTQIITARGLLERLAAN